MKIQTKTNLKLKKTFRLAWDFKMLKKYQTDKGFI